MDTNNNPPFRQSEQELGKPSPLPDQDSPPTIALSSRQPSSSMLGRESQDSGLGAVSDVHPSLPTIVRPDRDQHGKTSLIVDDGDLDTPPKSHKQKSTRLKDSNHLGQGLEPTRPSITSEDNNASDFSSHCTSDDVELRSISTEDDMTDDEEAGLNAQDKSHRRRRRKKNTQLDQRVVGVDQTSAQEKSKADKNVIQALLINALLIASWYLFSLSISIYNTWMFSPGHLNFHLPLFTTCMHMVVQFSLASTVLFFFPRFRPRHDSISNPAEMNHPNKNANKDRKPLMTRTFYVTRIGPCGAATGLDIGLGNMSLKYITLTFYTMCKSSSLAFVLLFAFVFRLETPSIKLILIIATMTIGVIMMVAGETAFNALGFILIISSAFSSGFRWALTQILLLRNPATSNPFSSIFFLAPVMFLTLAIIAIPVEGFSSLSQGLGVLTEEKGIFLGIGILLFPGVLAFLMTSSEYALLKRTSVVTLSICGIFKEVVTISAAGIVFHDPLTPINLSGLFVTILSIAAYNYLKITKMRKEAREELGRAHAGDDAAQPMLSTVDVLESPLDVVEEDLSSKDGGRRGPGEASSKRR